MAIDCGSEQGIKGFLGHLCWYLFGSTLDAGLCSDEYDQQIAD
jgi:hypothetical protein